MRLSRPGHTDTQSPQPVTLHELSHKRHRQPQLRSLVAGRALSANAPSDHPSHCADRATTKARGRSPQRVDTTSAPSCLQTQHRPQHSDESLSPRPCPVESIGDTWRDAHFLQGASRCAPLAHNRSLQAVRTLRLTMSSIMSSIMSNPDGSCSRALPIIPSAWAVAPISELISPSSLTTPTPVEPTSVAMGLRRATPPHCRVM